MSILISRSNRAIPISKCGIITCILKCFRPSTLFPFSLPCFFFSQPLFTFVPLLLSFWSYLVIKLDCFWKWRKKKNVATLYLLLCCAFWLGCYLVCACMCWRIQAVKDKGWTFFGRERLEQNKTFWFRWTGNQLYGQNVLVLFLIQPFFVKLGNEL